jgi:hypothetical protein
MTDPGRGCHVRDYAAEAIELLGQRTVEELTNDSVGSITRSSHRGALARSQPERVRSEPVSRTTGGRTAGAIGRPDTIAQTRGRARGRGA